ncbi:TlpA disulfide reductase family protein [Erythrobacter sp. YT30]|uniref:TlpA family protein disulfide reductase n=1 Tax=Erythrobacter sp. YT30 TaxID=1735012 RepID=UPI00076DF148|nr:TlpA disulfide reductase family protein [Erythrobacter sp. YT30]KWV90453.1 thiol:disulfide interchange protein [Erythrobacter sp. YT30]
MFRMVAFVSLAALALAGCDSGAGDAAQESAASTGSSEAAGAAPPPPQIPGKIVRAFAGTQLPDLTFEDAEGNNLDLAAIDQPVLLNLWATWCAPCVIEMPTLDTLAGELDGDVRVITVSQDVRGAEVVEPFFADKGFKRLEPWLDPDADLAAEFTDAGLLPITILFDAEGKELLRVAGGYEWDSEEAIAAVTEAIQSSQSAE